MPITPTSPSYDAEITSFLKSIEMTLRQFSRRDFTRAKKKISDVMFDLEMEILHGESAQPLNTLCPSAMSQITAGLMLCKTDRAPPHRPLLTVFEHGYITLLYKFCF